MTASVLSRAGLVAAVAALMVTSVAGLAPTVAAKAQAGDTIHGDGEIECMAGSFLVENRCEVTNPEVNNTEEFRLEAGAIDQVTVTVAWEPVDRDAKRLEVSLAAESDERDGYSFVERTEESPIVLTIDDPFLKRSSSTSLAVDIQLEDPCQEGFLHRPLDCDYVPPAKVVRDQPYEYTWELE